MVETKPKVVLITGAGAGGIGGALTSEFARQRCIVYASALRMEDMSGIEITGDIRKLTLNVNDADNIDSVVKTIIDAEQRIDILVNNAGVLAVGAILDVPITQIQSVFQTNFFAPIRLIQKIAPLMAANRTQSDVKGLIVNMGSVNAIVPVPWGGVYAMTKAGIRNLTMSLYNELSPFGVRVMLVEPGGIRSTLSHNTPSYTLPPNSLYQAYLPKIIARISVSQEPGALLAEEFARQLVKASLPPKPSFLARVFLLRSTKWNPRFYLSIGGNSGIFWLLSLLPMTWSLSVIWAVAGKVKK